ncbi:MAG: WD40/YVTN/BNR-like repeat-containing protein, partial [Vulcanimicrobiaceae bacterium]
MTRRATIASALCTLALLLAAAPACARSFNPNLYDQMRWRPIGPFRGGRTVAVSGVPSEPGIYYMAAVDGGVWKSTDYGRTWKPIFDGQDTGSIGALAVAPSNPNVIYAGSGEGLRRPDLSVGDGIYRSTDAGKTWTHLGLRDGQQINAIAVDPRDPNRLFAAVLGHPYGPNAQRGLYRSADGGKTWQKVLGHGVDTGAVTVVIDPRDPDVVYAALWASRNGPWHFMRVYEHYRAGGLYKSTDGGTTWTKLTRGLPLRVGRIGIAVGASPSARAGSPSQRLYAIVERPAGCGVYRSDDAGASWTQTDTERRVCGRTEDFAGITA